ncbi:MAG: hypothetical protein IJE05_07625 [Clostridia bacterium]|nr:hypothetical protein [Clostridia bacterium]
MKDLKAYKFTTGKDLGESGEINIYGLQEGWYRIIEVGSKNDEYEVEGYPSVDIYIEDLTINKYDAPLYIVNDKATTNVSGFIWEDMLKTATQNVYDKGKEQGVDGITVRLKDTKGQIVVNADGESCETISKEQDLYSEIQGGEYIFEGIDRYKLNEYYVEFEYDGLIYQSVDFASGNNDTINSKAIEGTKGENRTYLDEKFTNGIVNNGNNSVKVNGRDDITIGYKDTADPTVKEIDKDSIKGCDITARTQMYGWDEDNSLDLDHLYGVYGDGVMYVNLGIYEKPQADLALKQDVNNANVDITVQITTEKGDEINTETNNYSQVYNYHKITANDTTPNSSTWDDTISFKTNEYNKIQFYQEDTGYQPSVQSQSESEGGEESEEEEERVTVNISYNLYVTYKIAIVNQSEYNAITNSIAEYYSPDYQFLAARTESGQNLSVTDMGTVNDGKYRKCIIDTNLQTDAGKGNWIYIDFKVTGSALQRAIDEGAIDGYSTAEINSYKVFKDSYENTVAAVDIDSVPGNTNPESVETYEDDTQDAIVGIIRKIRTLSGTVFEDFAITKGEGNIREGNGILDNADKKIGGIKVTLKGPTTRTTTTSDDGSYKFEGFLPGVYEIIYTWGDNEYRVQDYKATIYKYGRNTGYEWYKDNVGTNYSDATDDYNMRILIDDQTAAIKDRSIYDELDKAYNGEESKITYTKMKSTTPKMQFGIEYDSSDPSIPFEVNNVDFGIIERAVQDLDVQKKVRTFKVTLANGQILIDTKVNDDGILEKSHENTIYMKPNNNNGNVYKGLIKAEIDGELMEGALAEIGYEMTYINKSELDYMTSTYYMYGSQLPVEESDLVTLKPMEAVDYLDKKLGFDSSKNLTEGGENIWEQIDKDDVMNYYPDGEKPENIFLNERSLLIEKNKIKELLPGENTEIYLNVSKLLSSSENATFNNKIDTVIITKPDIPDKTKPRGRVVEDFPEADAEEVQITPSTGDNRGYAIFIIVGIVSLVILGVGIYFIKIKVID